MSSILDEAQELITHDRADAYGPPEEGGSFGPIALGWSVILGTTVRPRDVALCMVWLKVVRDAHGYDRDNLVDIAGYAALAEYLE